jgi:hypothetical protein
MKKIFVILALSLSVGAFAQTAPSGVVPTSTAAVVDIKTVLSFKETAHDMGKIAYGKPIEFDVEITNISKTPVKIDDVRVSCGCTTPKFDKEKEIAPGATAKVTLGFSGYADGKFEKNVTILFSGGLVQPVKFFGETVKEEVKN